MSYEYFAPHPTIIYNDRKMINLFAHVGIVQKVLDQYRIYYPYDIKEEDKPDNLAYRYYDDSNFYWLVLLPNKIIDPYYDWPLGYHDFNAFIKAKYGSVESTMNTQTNDNIVYYYHPTKEYNMSVETYNYFYTNQEWEKLSDGPSDPADLSSWNPTEEDIVWKPLRQYDYEYQRNEARKSIKLIDRIYKDRIYEELRDILEQ